MGQRAGAMANRIPFFGSAHAEGAAVPADGASAEARAEAGRASRGRRDSRAAATGALTAPHSGVLENADGASNQPSERFLSTHCLLGGKRFELPRPDSFLFGTNADLDMLNAPVKFPYGSVADMVSPLNALINIRRDSIKVVREPSAAGDCNSLAKSKWRLQFIYDCDVSCYVQVHFCAREVLDGTILKFDVRYPELKPTKKVYCTSGADQLFDEMMLKGSKFDPHKMSYNGGLWFPVIIEMRTHNEDIGLREQAQLTMCILERISSADAPLVLKSLKQKLVTDGVVYLLQEVFGIENRETDRDRAFECSICKDAESDTLLLPCRHLCICNNCDDSFLLNVKECPICRTPVKALLTLDAVRCDESGGGSGGDAALHRIGHLNVEHIKLTEALNGPIARSAANTISRCSTASLASHSRVDTRNATPSRSLSSIVFHQPNEAHSQPVDAIELQDITLHT